MRDQVPPKIEMRGLLVDVGGHVRLGHAAQVHVTGALLNRQVGVYVRLQVLDVVQSLAVNASLLRALATRQPCLVETIVLEQEVVERAAGQPNLLNGGGTLQTNSGLENTPTLLENAKHAL